MNQFGERLKNARKLKGLTQKDLADMIHAKHNSVSNWENNHNKPDPDTIELICGVLDVSPNYLLGVSSPEILNDEVILLNQYRQLDETGKRELLHFMDRELLRIRLEKELQTGQTQIIQLEEALMNQRAK